MLFKTLIRSGVVAAQKSSSWKWEELFYYFNFLKKAVSHLSVRLSRMELAPYLVWDEQVAKASSGHYPLPFLISDI